MQAMNRATMRKNLHPEMSMDMRQAVRRSTRRRLPGAALMVLGLLGLLAGPARAAISTTDWERYDGDRDGGVSLTEFKAQEGDERAFREADANQDGRLDDTEFVKARSIDVRLKAGSYFDDGWITTKVKASLVKDDLMNGLDIKVTTQNGVVQLSGFVESSEQAARAVHIASGVEGVKQLENNLLIKK